MKPSVLLPVLCACILSSAHAQEWTRFRGPNGTGITHAPGIPSELAQSHVQWAVDLPGKGHSSPVLWSGRIFLTAADQPGTISVLCLRAEDGDLIWRKDFPHRPFRTHKFNNFASPSPAVDAERVYISWVVPEKFTLMALDHGGETVWERDLGPFSSQHGGGASPMVLDSMVIIGNQQREPGFVIAVDAATGETIWKTPRKGGAAAYSTPVLYQPEDGPPALLLMSEAHGIYALDPKTGKPLWEFPDAFDKRSVSSPVAAGSIIFGSCGSGGGGNFVTALRVDSKGLNPERAYEIRRSAPYVPTIIAKDELAWLWSDGGILTCLHAPTGEIRYTERVGGNFFGSPIWVSGRLFAVSTSGEVVVIEASGQFRVLSRLPLNDTCHTTPAVDGGRMFIRTERKLFCVAGNTGS